jgi:MSHA pilin protein MshC
MKAHLRSLGFTLIELIVVIVLLGILSAVLLPRSNTNAILVSTQAEQLAADIRYVQSLAMTQGWSGVNPRRYYISYTVASAPAQYAMYSVSPVSINPVIAVAPPSGGASPISLAGITLSSSGLGNNLIAFDALGAPYTDQAASTVLSTTSATITLTGAQGTSRTIQVFPGTGMVRVQ